MLVASNNLIPPGIACRLTYDAKGLILKGEGLRVEDIPELPIEKITGLLKVLGNKLEPSALDNIKPKEDPFTNKIQAGTGTKINYNENGLITSSSDLLTSDIPELPMEKIQGLNDKLNFLESQINNTPDENIEKFSVNPGTYTKVTYDSLGRITGGSKLSMDDIPMDLISKMNILESRIPLLASQQTVNAIIEDLKNKLNSNTPITPGIYTKMTVDEKGLVTFGESLTIKDLPEFQISNITNLESILRKKADQSDLIQLTNTVSSIVSNGGSTDIIRIQSELGSKASNDDLKVVSNKVDTVKQLVDTVIEKLPGDLIIEQLNQIQNTLSALSSRVTIIEKQLKIPEV
jgi:hypothetical protein